MNVGLVEISAEQVIGLNRTAVEQARRWDAKCQQKHAVRDLNGIKACVGGIFQQLSPVGYMHLPMEKMAGLLLYRIAQGQYFLDANKRTALLATAMSAASVGFVGRAPAILTPPESLPSTPFS